MPNPIQSVQYAHFTTGEFQSAEAEVIVETPVSLTVNGSPWLTFMCTPVNLEAMAVGFLYNEGVIESIEDVVDVRLCEHGDNLDVWLKFEVERPDFSRRTSGCTGGVTSITTGQNETEPVPSLPPVDDLHVSPELIGQLIDLLFESQQLYRESGGVHTSALSDGEQILVSAEDIGRHNTFDKLTGLCLQGNIWPERRILLTTGRISSEMLQKAARLGVRILVSRTSPSSLSIEMAKKRGLTLIGYARRNRFNVYTHPERLFEKQPQGIENK